MTLSNGAYGANKTFNAAITIDEADDIPVKVCGAAFGQVTMSGTISGKGRIEFSDGGAFGMNADGTIKYPCDNPVSVNSNISGELQVVVRDEQVVAFGGQNTFTGGFVLPEGKAAKITNAKALGTGIATIDGTLQVGGSGLGSKVTGSGVIAATASETVQFVDGNAIIPSYENVLTINGKVGGTPIFDISTMDLANGKRFNLLKVNAVENLPEPFTDANFVNGESNPIPKGWIAALTPDGLGYCLKREAFMLIIR
ncbi:MAG: hypothetical protein IKV56_00020 [Kiritimatiellae bacterium]|nr:hypothetical protein [Kiritimatiellia bacterium]